MPAKSHVRREITNVMPANCIRLRPGHDHAKRWKPRPARKCCVRARRITNVAAKRCTSNLTSRNFRNHSSFHYSADRAKGEKSPNQSFRGPSWHCNARLIAIEPKLLRARGKFKEFLQSCFQPFGCSHARMHFPAINDCWRDPICAAPRALRPGNSLAVRPICLRGWSAVLIQGPLWRAEACRPTRLL